MSQYKPYKYRVYRGSDGLYYPQCDREDGLHYVTIGISRSFPESAEEDCRQHARDRKRRIEMEPRAGVYKELGYL